jgi:hypothetical protein
LTGGLGKEPGSFFLYFEIYNRVQLDSVRLVCKFINSKQEVVLQLAKNERCSGGRMQEIWQIDTPALAADQYVILIEAAGYSNVLAKTQLHASVSRTCIVRIKNLPPTISDINKATEQLLYIAKESEIDYIKAATTPDEKLKRFLEFWSKRDPDPKTPRNELMEEYFLRVAYANKNFSNYLDG